LVPMYPPSKHMATKLYCFPFAGGTSRAFCEWKHDAFHVMAVENVRLDDKSRQDEEIVASIARAMEEDAAGFDKLVFCGLSAGALLALEVYSALSQDIKARVVHFSVFGRMAPKQQNKMEEDFEKYSLASPEITATDEWTNYFLPLLVADLEADARANKRLCGTSKILNCPLFVGCGTEDPAFSPNLAHEWSSMTTGPVSIGLFQGDHSFLLERQVFKRLCEHLQQGIITPTSLNSSRNAFQMEWKQLQRIQRSDISLAKSNFVHVQLQDSVVSVPSELDAATMLVVQLKPLEYFDLEYEQRQAWCLIQLVQQLVGMEIQLILVGSASTQGSMAFGASKAIAMEFPEIVCRRILVDQALVGATPEWLQDVLSCIERCGDAETDLWIRKEGRRRISAYAPRLEPLLSKEVDAPLGKQYPNQAFVITGGTGGIGKVLVEWLVGKQQVEPQNVVLLSRRSFVHPQGVTVVETDYTSPDQLSKSLSTFPPVAGVFHLAGVLDDGVLINMTEERLDRVVSPKVKGASVLLDVMDKLEWDPVFFVNFSSTSSLFGYPGQSNYSAANSYLDALSCWDSEDRDVAMLTINWGPWGQVGMSQKGTKAYDLAVKHGDIPLSNEFALNTLEHIISRGSSSKGGQYAVCSVDWHKSLWKKSPLVAHLLIEDNDATTTITDNNNEMVYTSDHEEDEEKKSETSSVQAFLKSHLSAWLLNESLADLGMDSLDMVQLRGSFQKTFHTNVPVSMFMNPQTKLRDFLNQLEELL